MRLPEFIAVQIPAWSSVPELSRRRRMIVLAVCCSAVFMVGFDNTSVNVAVPSIGRQLHASVAGQQWTVAAYLIVLASHAGWWLLAGCGYAVLVLGLVTTTGWAAGTAARAAALFEPRRGRVR